MITHLSWHRLRTAGTVATLRANAARAIVAITAAAGLYRCHTTVIIAWDSRGILRDRA